MKKGNRVQITLPGNESVTGKVDRLGRVAQIPAGQNATAGAATIQSAIATIITFSVREMKPKGTLLSPPTHAHFSSRLSR